MGSLLGGLRCNHESHAPLLGKDPQTLHFRTREAQSYPPALCEVLAKAFVDFLNETELVESVSEVVSEPERPAVDLGERVQCPPMSADWDPISRWSEVARWAWKETEHNNILEARAALGCLKLLLRSPQYYGHRVLLFSDSQVVIGCFSKGRSSTRVLNYLARRAGAIRLATGIRVYWRYVPTHRNHADAPSRNKKWGTLPDPSELLPSGAPLPSYFYVLTKG